jgi:hypothetical protein
MALRFTYPRLAAGLAAGAIAGLFLSGVAYAVTSNVFRYSVPKTGWYSINPSDLSPDFEGRTYTINYTSGSIASNSSGCFQTGLHLPDRATITGLSAWSQEGTDSGVEVWIFRERLSDGLGDNLLKDFSHDTSGLRVGKLYQISGPAARINNRAYSYGFAICLNNATSAFYSARIAYTYDNAGARLGQ